MKPDSIMVDRELILFLFERELFLLPYSLYFFSLFSTMKFVLPLQIFLGRGDGVASGNSMHGMIDHGTFYWVRPIIGPLKPGTIVLAVAKREWMGSKKRLIKNFIMKKVIEVQVRRMYFFFLLLHVERYC